MNQRTLIEISEDRSMVTTQLSRVSSETTESADKALRIQELETRIKELNEEEARLLAGYALPGQK